MNELELLVDLHRFSERQGPGSEEETLQALNLCNLQTNAKLSIADIGCGSGAQTITLAKQLEGNITAIDLFDEFLDELEERKRDLILNSSVETLKASMENLPLDFESLDLIWSEGAIYNMGFEQGVKYWNRFLKRAGCLAVSEITWTSNSRPMEIEEYWKAEYPEIGTASEKIKILEANGYTLNGYFTLAESSWLDNYYQPLTERFDAFLDRNGHSKLAQEVVKLNKSEIELFRKFKEHFSYGFYVAQKSG